MAIDEAIDRYLRHTRFKANSAKRSMTRKVEKMRKLSIITPLFAAMVGTVLLLPAEASAAETKPVKDKDVAPSSLGPACNYHPGFAATDVITVTVATNLRQEAKQQVRAV